MEIDEAADKMTFATLRLESYLWKIILPTFLHMYPNYMDNVRDIDRFSDEWNDVTRDKLFKPIQTLKTTEFFRGHSLSDNKVMLDAHRDNETFNELILWSRIK